VDPRAALDSAVKGKILSPCRDSKPRSSTPQPSATPMSYPSSTIPRTSNYLIQKLTYKITTFLTLVASQTAPGFCIR